VTFVRRRVHSALDQLHGGTFAIARREAGKPIEKGDLKK
jgi:hypothetical protein